MVLAESAMRSRSRIVWVTPFLKAALTPIQKIRDAEYTGDYTTRLALLEENKSLPFAPVWDYYCMKSGVPVGENWLANVKEYESKVLSLR